MLAQFGDASPDLIDARALQRRVDRKYMVPKRLVGAVLERLASDYRVARAAGALAARYETIYFDTADRQLFEDHRRGRRPRYKVRVRHHRDRRLSFVEVKQKGGCTSKARLEVPFSGGAGDVQPWARVSRASLDGEASRFVDEHCPVHADRLLPLLWVTFSRLTLVGDRINERVTLDWNIEYGDGEHRERLPDFVIAEIKQARVDDAGPASQALRRLNVREQTLSKYCLATVRLGSARAQASKPCLRTLERFSG